MIIKEWRCPHHGDFVSSHAICPSFGCDSEEVIQVFLTPPGIRSGLTRRIDQSMDKTARMYGLTDMNNRGGQAVLSADPNRVRWGDEGQNFLAQQGSNMASATHNGSGYTEYIDKKGKKHYADNMGMRATANATGIDQQVLPDAERTYHKHDAADRAKVTKS